MKTYDIIVVGGGPAGSSAALFSARAGLKTLLLEKESFPRDKVCGDAISGKSLHVLRKLDLLKDLEQLPQVRIKGVIFSSPAGDAIPVIFRSARPGETLHGYVSRRMDFDNFLFQKAKKEVTDCRENFAVTAISKMQSGVRVIKGRSTPGEIEEFTGRIIIGADGYKSTVARRLGIYEYSTKHTLVALRAYYQDVSGLSDFIEIHYVKESLPGYFWIFPLGDGAANVGIGMKHLDIKRRNIDLFRVLDNTIQSSAFCKRFENARLQEKIKGWNLPTGSIWRPNYSDGVLLAGDAAGLIDPFTGEGIGNAMTSAYHAVTVATKSIETGDTSAAFLAEYDNILKSELGSELKLSYRLQKIGSRYPFLLNLVIGKAARSRKVAEWISSMIADEVSKKDLTSPLTYLRLLRT